MGTSKNVPSPNIPAWKFALAVVGRLDVPTDRQTREIWRSVEAERGPTATNEFSDPTLAAACRIASSAKDVRSALKAYEDHIYSANKAGFAVEVAKRAIARSVTTQQGALGFAKELFAEATSYYASRDLSSFVGRPGRVKTVSDAISLKSRLKDVTRSIVEATGAPSAEPEAWSRYVDDVISHLRGPR